MFYTDEQRKDFGKTFFSFEDGKTIRVKVKNVSEQRFSDGKWELKLDIENVDTGEKWEKVMYQFDFANALDKLAQDIDENTVLEVTSTKTGTKPNKNNPEKPYDVWGFNIKIVENPNGDSAPEDNIRTALGLDTDPLK